MTDETRKSLEHTSGNGNGNGTAEHMFRDRGPQSGGRALVAGMLKSVIDRATRACGTDFRRSVPTITPLRPASPAKEDLRPGFG